MAFKSHLKKLLVPLGISALAYLNISYLHSFLAGALILAAQVVFFGRPFHLLLVKYFSFSAEAFRVKVLSLFYSLFILGVIGAPFAILSTFSSVNIAIIFFAHGILALLLKSWIGEYEAEEGEKQVIEDGPHAKVGLFIYILLLIYSFIILSLNTSSANIATPWQVIEPKFIIAFFFLTLTLGLLIFTGVKTKTLLFLIVLQMFLQHSYLPLSHSMIYGADQWRHMATESRLESGLSADLVNFGQGSFLQTLNVGKFAYSQFWSVSVLLGRILSVPLLSVSRWLLPIIWSVILPILLYEIGRALGWSKKESVFFAWLGLLPFALQVTGSFTLPAGFGFLYFLSIFLLTLKSKERFTKQTLLVLLLLGATLIFFHTLYFVLFVILFALVYISNLKIKNSIKYISLAAISGFTIPVLELMSGYSKAGFGIIHGVKQFVGNVLGYFLVLGPRDHDVATGNIIFNQTPSYAFMANMFTAWRWWILFFMIVFLVAFVYGLFLLSKDKNNLWLVFFVLGICVSYFISNYLWNGERILGRRLDPVMAILLLVPTFYTTQHLLLQSINRLKFTFIFIILSAAIAASYSLGPDTFAVSEYQYQTASYIWDQERSRTGEKCVVADKEVLLPLEFTSQKTIIGGGFPIDQYFGQPGLMELVELSKKQINRAVLDEAFKLTRADTCWFVGSVSDFKKQGVLVGGGYRVFGDIAVVRYNK